MATRPSDRFCVSRKESEKVFQDGSNQTQEYNFFGADGFNFGAKPICKLVAIVFSWFFSSHPKVCTVTWPFALDVTVHSDDVRITRFNNSGIHEILSTNDTYWLATIVSWFETE